ncbi:hypothetical protein FNH22_27170 [Fulvivirga sp. M361]|uniref:hypothetical protein n=1 Tax=Fulvivirga sp. M361 TaxID=2594266 RepID=UPI001179F445|nr:hypothetical protein [Fulvivirga sp. M361]TRX49310.1 hypothetical protein FNH22_27170 [Fulvivirga sp. M361]
MKKYSILLKTAAVLWFIWGAVHILAGVMTDKFILSGDISGAVGGIADAVDPATLQMNYPDATGAVIGQHGFNLLWIGLTTLICCFYVWKGSKNAIFLAALTGGLADLGYFLFMDLGGYVNFVPGTVMTLVSSAAIILSFTAYFKTANLKKE